MSVNIKELLGQRVPQWIAAHLAARSPEIVADPFWVIPIEESDPTYKELCTEGLKRFKTTELLGSLSHESLLFIFLKDAEGLKLCISNRDASLPPWDPSMEQEDFSMGDLNFLQLSHLVTKYSLPARAQIPSTLVNTSPVFEDDLLGYFPEIYVLSVNDCALDDSFETLSLKALIALEMDKTYVRSLENSILNVGYAIPVENHEWIFGQLFSAVRAQRLVNFYLEIYKLFEFFFPLDSIFNLADRLGYTESELVLLEYCRGALSWNVNHQRGARSATSYATMEFAEICLGESFTGLEAQAASFKEHAVEKLTAARHSLTHQDFRPSSVPENELLRLTAGLLVFLRDAFSEYGSKLEARRKRSSGSKHRSKMPTHQRSAKAAVVDVDNQRAS